MVFAHAEYCTSCFRVTPTWLVENHIMWLVHLVECAAIKCDYWELAIFIFILVYGKQGLKGISR